MSKLTGYAIPTGILDTDHTYVKSDNPPYSWGCWGRDDGGTAICEGYGNASISNCISQVLPVAGIAYAVNGVCHQTANRILYPARVIVYKARGYGASSYLYGDYGGMIIPNPFTRIFIPDPFWPIIINKCHAGLTSKLESKTEVDLENTPESQYIKRIQDLYSNVEYMATDSNHNELREKANDLIIKNFEYLIEFHLGDKVDSHITNQIQKQQIDVLKEKDRKVEELFNRDISTEKYVKEVNDLIADNLISLQESLGKNIYEKIFNLPASKNRFVLIDPEIAEKSLKTYLNYK
jgi:hypothetical protein